MFKKIIVLILFLNCNALIYSAAKKDGKKPYSVHPNILFQEYIIKKSFDVEDISNYMQFFYYLLKTNNIKLIKKNLDKAKLNFQKNKAVEEFDEKKDKEKQLTWQSVRQGWTDLVKSYQPAVNDIMQAIVNKTKNDKIKLQAMDDLVKLSENYIYYNFPFAKEFYKKMYNSIKDYSELLIINWGPDKGKRLPEPDQLKPMMFIQLPKIYLFSKYSDD